MMTTAICILNYNSWEDTVECMNSLLVQTISDSRIVIVDNASENNSVQMIAEECVRLGIKFALLEEGEKIDDEYRVYIVVSKKNGGFSYGNNVGLLFAKRNLKTDNIIFLNNDTVVLPDFLHKMQQSYLIFKEKYKKVALGCREYNYFSRKYSHKGFHYLHLFTGLAFKFPVFPYFKYICGACLMVDINAPEMDDTYFLYFDDTRYSKILKENGYKLCVTDSTKYFHKVSSTTNSLKSKKIEYQFESTWQFYRKHYLFFTPFVYLTRSLQYLITGKKETRRIIKRTYKHN